MYKNPMMRQFLCLVAVGFAAVRVLAAAEPEHPTFNRDIRPIMSDTCFRCHGPDRIARKADMRLDIREEAIKPTRSGRIPIVPGDPDKSQIIARIFAEGASVMPPASAHKALTQAQKETIRRWVADGAVYEGHWSYQPVKRPMVPAVADVSRIKNPIDNFIQERLHRDALTPGMTGRSRSFGSVLARSKSPTAMRKTYSVECPHSKWTRKWSLSVASSWGQTRATAGSMVSSNQSPEFCSVPVCRSMRTPIITGVSNLWDDTFLNVSDNGKRSAHRSRNTRTIRHVEKRVAT